MTSLPPQPAVSIIMPSYNVEATIERAIRSALAQKFPDFELLVVNDASTDGTSAEAGRIKAETMDDRIRIIDLPANVGLSGARNAGLDAARGKFVTFLDADDEILDSFLAEMTGAMTEDVDLVSCGHFVISLDGSAEPRKSPAQGLLDRDDAVKAAMTNKITPFTWDKLYRRELFEGVRYPVGSTRFEDMTVNIVLYARCRRIRIFAVPLHRYYISSGSLTWGRVPTEQDTGLALKHLHENMNARYRTGGFAPFYECMRTLMTMIVAQSAILKIQNLPAAAQTVIDCRRSLTVRRLAQCLRVHPVLAIGAAGLKLLPGLFSLVYRRYSLRSYGIATSTKTPSISG